MQACELSTYGMHRWAAHACAQVRVLSGGEKARLALAKFMLTPGSLLVLDEPTNHLDIPSKEMLEEAIVGFDGAVIAVSHDRYFLRQIATRIVAVRACWCLSVALTDAAACCHRAAALQPVWTAHSQLPC